MSAQLFLTAEEFLRVIQDELPEGVFAQDDASHVNPDKRSVSSSELRAAAVLFAQASDNLSLINDDKFLSTATATGLTAYEKEYFESAQDASQPILVRKQNLVSKVRATGGIGYQAIYSIIAGVLGDTPFDLLANSGQLDGAWRIGISQLGVRTYAAELDPLRGALVNARPLDCSLDAGGAELTQSQVEAIQRTAYQYRVRIYGNAEQATLNLLDNRLSTYEPARSSHVILNNETAGPSDAAAYRAATPDFERLRLS